MSEPNWLDAWVNDKSGSPIDMRDAFRMGYMARVREVPTPVEHPTTTKFNSFGAIMPKMRIYVAGPYSADSRRQRVMNVNAAIDAAIEIIALGHYPYVPHLTHYIDERNNSNPERARIVLGYEDFMRMDYEWLKACEGFVQIGRSPGADREREAAVGLRSHIIIFPSLADIPAAGSLVTAV